MREVGSGIRLLEASSPSNVHIAESACSCYTSRTYVLDLTSEAPKLSLISIAGTSLGGYFLPSHFPHTHAHATGQLTQPGPSSC